MIDFDKAKLVQLCNDLDLSLIVLFGSQATGKTRTESDIDIAVLSDRKVISPEYKFEVWEAFLWFFKRADVDVIMMNHVPSLLGYRIAITGQVLYESRPSLWRDFRLLAVKKHADAKKVYDLRKEYLRRTIKELRDG